jgi:DNA-binding transcriptional ArsR family regulator
MLRRDGFQAIADPPRREIIHLLSGDSLNLNAVADHFEISRPAVSKHIKILTECGLLIIRRNGRERICQADRRKLKTVADWTETYRSFWSQKMDALETFLEKGNKFQRKKK